MRIAGPVHFGPWEALVLLALFVGPFVASFLVGAISPASLVARVVGKDLRGSGSGNPGATNAGRVLGVRWGILVGVLDVLKGYLPCVAALHWFGLGVACECALGVVLGHMFSPFLKGRGGKGVATTLGALLAIAPWIALLAVAVFGVGMLGLRRVGEASVLTCVALVVVGIAQVTGVTGRAPASPVGWVVIVLALLVLVRHRRNILIGIERRKRAVHRD